MILLPYFKYGEKYEVGRLPSEYFTPSNFYRDAS